MTITFTDVADFHRGSGSANTHTFSGGDAVDLVAGERVIVWAHALRNGGGSWTPSTEFGITDDATETLVWSYFVSGDPFTTNVPNGTSLIVAVSDELTNTQGGRELTLDFDTSDSTSYLYGAGVITVSTDSGNPIEIVQSAVAVGTSAVSIDWPSTPAAAVFAAWGMIHNSTPTFPAEPTGLTALQSNSNSVPAYEIQTGASTDDPLSWSPTVSGTSFHWHAVGIEFDDSGGAGSELTEEETDTAGGADSASVALGRARSAVDSATGSDALSVALGRSREALDTATGTDSVEVALARSIETTDTAAGADAASTATTGARTETAVDSAAGSDTTAVGYGPAAVDPAAGGDSVALALARARTVVDTAAGSDSIEVALARVVEVTDTAAGSDTTGRVLDNGTEAPVGHGVADVALAHDVVVVEEAHTVTGVELAHDVVGVVGRDGMEIERRGLESMSAEEVLVKLRSRKDPTGSDVEFAVSTVRRNQVDPGDLTWVAGEWSPGGWDSSTGRVDAFTPTIGESGDLVVAEGTIDLWVRWTSGASVPVKLASSIPIR